MPRDPTPYHDWIRITWNGRGVSDQMVLRYLWLARLSERLVAWDSIHDADLGSRRSGAACQLWCIVRYSAVASVSACHAKVLRCDE